LKRLAALDVLILATSSPVPADAEEQERHEVMGFGFIKMRDPKLSPLETSPFSDEAFSAREGSHAPDRSGLSLTAMA
jgi:hypothetical protein